MTDAAPTMNGPTNGGLATRSSNEAVSKGLKRRYAAERRFKAYGILAIAFAMGMLGLLFTTIVSKAIPAFTQTMINLEITLYPQDIDPQGTRDRQTLSTANYRNVIRQAFYDLFPDVTNRRDRRDLFDMISPGAVYEIRDMVMANPNLIGERVVVQMPMSDDIDQLNKGQIRKDSPEAERRVKDKQIAWFERLENRGLIETVFNTTFFTAGDSREPELAGIFGAAMGSLFTMFVTLLVSFPLAVASAIYLEEFAPVNKWTQTIEVNINNLAAVPSIVFGLLGLAVFINFFGMPRSAPVVGGLVLALMTLPTIIIAARSALKSVPPSIREAAYGLGASPLQVITHHVLPLAMPGILTGTIIGMAQALGETAPLLMIGMVAFIVDVPHGALDPATVLPVQIYLWADSPERAFVERTSAAICVLLAFLVIMNVGAVFLRKRFERKW
ncbi:phosphate ABC transporter permease PstA [Thalassospiraceae bacterium LMO-SO8]|nr:phosphate ABC transporter permease PstA [Alphaproteobacteria bacterium LMO-S08]WND77228.1 phosphate ABC transporter permease PstA [Thalassospiraceae bacterium LMO-SO8]